MSILQRFRAAVDTFTGANALPIRSDPSAIPTDGRKELSRYTRRELLKKARWLEDNLGLIKRLVKGVSRYSVGGGIVHLPATSDAMFNEAASDYFDEWAGAAPLCDITGERTFWRMQDFVARSMMRDGEMFAGLVQNPLFQNRPALQLLPTERVDDLNGAPADGFIEGIRKDATGRSMFFRVLQDLRPEDRDLRGYSDVPANGMIHVADPERVGQIHSATWFYHGTNSAIDILDLTALEKLAVKVHSSFAAAIKRKQPGAGRFGFSGDLRQSPATRAGGPTVNYENFAGGAAILNLGEGEEFTLATSNRPATTWTGFLDWLVRDLAWGFGVSPEFIWAVAGMGGANTRFILEDARWFFEYVQQLLVDLFCQRVYAVVIADGVTRGELRLPMNEREFTRCDWRGPKQITVDQGREGNLEIARLRNAMMNWDDFYAARGQVGRVQVKKRIDELQWAMRECEAAGVPFEYLFAPQAGAAAPNTDSEETPTKPEITK